MNSYASASSPPVPFMVIGGAGYAEGNSLTQNFTGFGTTNGEPSLGDLVKGNSGTQFQIPDIQTLIVYAVVIFVAMKFIK